MKTSITDLQSRSLEGYIWLSDKDRPFINDEINDYLEEPTDSFIVEGKLFDKQAGESINILFINGTYDIDIFKLPEDYKASCFPVANRLALPFKAYKVYFHWEEESVLCNPKAQDDDFKFLSPSKPVFVGFEQKKAND